MVGRGIGRTARRGATQDETRRDETSRAEPRQDETRRDEIAAPSRLGELVAGRARVAALGVVHEHGREPQVREYVARADLEARAEVLLRLRARERVRASDASDRPSSQWEDTRASVGGRTRCKEGGGGFESCVGRDAATGCGNGSFARRFLPDAIDPSTWTEPASTSRSNASL